MMFYDDSKAVTMPAARTFGPHDDDDGTRPVYIFIPDVMPPPVDRETVESAGRHFERVMRVAGGGPVSNSVEPHRNRPRVGRNAPCPCNCGRKAKRCREGK